MASLLATPAFAVQSDIYDEFTACRTDLIDQTLVDDPDFCFADCGCVASIAKPGSTFRIGDRTTTTTERSSTQWAFGSFDEDLDSLPVIPGSTSLMSQPEKVEGGLLGLALPPETAPLGDALDPVLGVQTQVHSAGDVSDWRLGFEPTTVPIKIKLINPVLGDNCFIGSDDDPIVLRLATVEPGQLEFVNDPNGFEVFVIRATGLVLRDDTFAVPEARGCGPLGLGTLDPLINEQLGLPSPEGNNEAVFLNDTDIVGAADGTTMQSAFDAAQ